MEKENNINKEYCDSLELPKVLAMLSAECTGERARRAAMQITPSADLFTVKREVGKASAALDMSIRCGTPIFYGLDGVGQALKHCGSGAVLSLAELIAIRKLLTQINTLADWYEKADNKRPELEYLFESLFPNKYLEQKLDVSIIDENELADEASSELASIRRKITACGPLSVLP